MFIKGVLSFILAHIIILGSSSTKVYVATTSPTQNAPSSTSTKTTVQNDKPVVVISKIDSNKSSTTKTTATKTQKPKMVIKKENATTTPKLEPFILPDFEKVNTAARQTIVNILCSTKGSELSPISGTGVIINEKGIILTNAHIGQYFLLKDYKEKDKVSCIIRTGSPAYPTYKAELEYISPNWIKENNTILKSQDPKGTGENDFAFLHITERIDGNKLPDGFVFIFPDIREVIEKNEPVLLISYPAGFLGGLSIIQNLNITSAITSIQDIFTFKQNTIDLLSVGGTVVSQKGSSGGAVIDKYVSLLGIISTSSNGDYTSQRDLRAITVAHINRSLQAEIGINLSTFLSQNPTEFSKTFASTSAPVLTKIITDVLEKNQ